MGYEAYTQLLDGNGLILEGVEMAIPARKCESPRCGLTYEPRRKDQRFCGDPCRAEWWNYVREAGTAQLIPPASQRPA